MPLDRRKFPKKPANSKRMSRSLGSQFGDLPPGKHLLTQISTRPDAAVDSPITTTISDYHIRLSTTTVDTLSTTYADNVGSDETIVLFDGSQTSSIAVGPSGVKDFDYVTNLEEPFFYDPSQGNLLVENWSQLGFSAPFEIDQVSGSVMQRVGTFGTGVDLTGEVSASEVHDGNIPVFQFTFFPIEESELAGDVDANGEVDFADFLVLSANFGNDVDPAGSSGDIDGNGNVDFSDFLILSANFGQSAGAVASVPEPTGLVLLLFGVGIIGTVRQQRD